MLFLVIVMAFKQKMLYCFYWAIIAFWAFRAVGTFDTVEVFVETYVAGVKLEQKQGLCTS